MISAAKDFDHRFRFFVGTTFTKDDSSSSPVDVDIAVAVVNKETVTDGTIFGSLWKNSLVFKFTILLFLPRFGAMLFYFFVLLF